MRFWRSMRQQKPAQADTGFQRYEAYSKLLDRNGRWIEVADTKAAVILAFLIAVFPLLLGPAIPALHRMTSAIRNVASFWNYVPSSLFIALIVAFGLSALFTLLSVLWVLLPRLSGREWTSGLLYFGDIAALKNRLWQEALQALDPDTVALHVLDQVYVTACIADCKHKYVRRAIRGLLLTVVVGLVLYVWGQIAS